jgi:folate-binding protein YgfZ
MGLVRTPLFAVHGAHGATFTELDGHLVPERWSTPEREAEAGRSSAALFDLTRSAVLELVGPDARRFSNGMFTNNVRALPVGGGNRSCMVDEKARIQGILDLYCVEEERFLAVLEGVTAEAFEARYGKYIIFDDVELIDRSAALRLLALQGPAAAEVLARAGLPVPGSGRCVRVEELIVASCSRSVAGGFDLLVPEEALQPTWQALLASGGVPAGSVAQEILRVEAGIARWPVDMGERALLHEMRLVERCAAFDKGCYIGQEIINRIDVMGQVKQKLWGLDLHEDAWPPPGAEVKVGDTLVGVVRSGAREGARVRVLALLKTAAWSDGLEVSVHAAGRSVSATVRDLPFRAGASPSARG